MSGRPTTSNAWSAPRPVIRTTRAAVAAEPDSTECVGAARESELELRRIEVDRDDRVGAREAQRRDHLQADAAATDHRSRLASPDPRRVPYGAERRYDAAAEEGRLPQWKGAGERHRSGGGHDRALREARGHQCVLERCAVGS